VHDQKSCSLRHAVGFDLGRQGYAALTERLLSLADGRVVLALEGGYNLDAIARSAAACLRVLLGEESPHDFGSISPAGARKIEETIEVQREFWKGL